MKKAPTKTVTIPESIVKRTKDALDKSKTWLDHESMDGCDKIEPIDRCDCAGGYLMRELKTLSRLLRAKRD